MHVSRPAAVALGFALGCSFALHAPSALAVDKARAMLTNAPSICQSALPAFEGVLRSRPLALQNEGASNAFVTCSFLADIDNVSINNIAVRVSNNNAASTAMTCTAVVGRQAVPATVQYITKSVGISAHGSGLFQFLPSDFAGGDTPTTLPISLSCSVKPGTGLNELVLYYSEDVG